MSLPKATRTARLVLLQFNAVWLFLTFKYSASRNFPLYALS